MAWKIIDSAFVNQIKFKIHKSSFVLYIFYVLEEAIKLYCSVKQDIQNGDRVHLTFFVSGYIKTRKMSDDRNNVNVVGVLTQCHKIKIINQGWHIFLNLWKGKVWTLSPKLSHSRSYLLGVIIPKS